MNLYTVSNEFIWSPDEPDCEFSYRETVQKALLAGVELYQANLSNIDLSHLDFSGKDLTYASFHGAKLVQTDFRGAKLFGAAMINVDLSGADLCQANIRSVLFTGSYLTDIKIDTEIPVVEDLDQKIWERACFSTASLNMSTFDYSENIHSWGGWIIVFAGEEGKKLKQEFGNFAAASLIYAKSTGKRIPDFDCSKEIAMVEMKRRAVQSLHK